MMEQRQKEYQACNFHDIAVTSRTICSALLGILSEHEKNGNVYKQPMTECPETAEKEHHKLIRSEDLHYDSNLELEYLICWKF